MNKIKNWQELKKFSNRIVAIDRTHLLFPIPEDRCQIGNFVFCIISEGPTQSDDDKTYYYKVIIIRKGSELSEASEQCIAFEQSRLDSDSLQVRLASKEELNELSKQIPNDGSSTSKLYGEAIADAQLLELYTPKSWLPATSRYGEVFFRGTPLTTDSALKGEDAAADKSSTPRY